MNKFLKSAICILLTVQLSFFPAFAKENSVTELNKGQKAPFAGILMTKDVATKLYLDAEFSPKECDLKISEKIQLADASCQKDKKML